MRRSPWVAVWVVSSVVTLAGCRAGSTSPASGTPNSPQDAASMSAADSASSGVSTPTGRVAVVVAIGGRSLPAHLNGSQAARALVSRLPVTLSFRDFAQGFEEKVSDLDQALPFDQMSAGDDPRPGDIAYWSPDQRLVLYWGDVGRYDGIHVIGSFDDPASTSAVRALTPSAQVTITRAG